MNYRFVVSQFGALLVVLSGIMLLLSVIFFTVEWSVHEAVDPSARLSLLLVGGSGLVTGAILWWTARSPESRLARREALLLVALSWIAGAAFAALPFFFWAWLEFGPEGAHPFNNYINCYFEAMSGLTTTGATVLSNIEAIPKSLLLWRAFTHWLGGIGIVVLFVAVLPLLGVGGKRLFQVEAPGPTKEGVRPHIAESARVLFGIYVGFTLVEIVALRIAGMPLFDAICHTFATLATGGFSSMNASAGAWHHLPAVDWIILVFMVLAGANFGLYYQLLRHRWDIVRRDSELRLYLILLLVASALVVLSIHYSGSPITLTDGQQVQAGWGESIRQGVFTTVSIQTTTGFATSDFNLFPFLAQAVLIMLMFVGGCAGSTGGGIKVIRIWVAFRVMISEIERVFRPNVIRPVRIGGKTIDDDLKLATIAYVLGIIILFVLGSGGIMLIEQLAGSGCDFTSASTASLASLCTIGPGLAKVGAVENYGWFSDWSKALMCILMALGRLEVFAIIVLLSPKFWRGD